MNSHASLLDVLLGRADPTIVEARHSAVAVPSRARIARPLGVGLGGGVVHVVALQHHLVDGEELRVKQREHQVGGVRRRKVFWQYAVEAHRESAIVIVHRLQPLRTTHRSLLLLGGVE